MGKSVKRVLICYYSSEGIIFQTIFLETSLIFGSLVKDCYARSMVYEL